MLPEEGSFGGVAVVGRESGKGKVCGIDEGLGLLNQRRKLEHDAPAARPKAEQCYLDGEADKRAQGESAVALFSEVKETEAR